MAGAPSSTEAFFDRYTRALLARDERAMARLYAVPSLILFPGNPVVVTDPARTEAFFASSWAQYDGVDAVERHVVVLAETAGSTWADVTWAYDGAPRERFCYQLVPGPEGHQVAVLTPMSLP